MTYSLPLLFVGFAYLGCFLVLLCVSDAFTEARACIRWSICSTRVLGETVNQSSCDEDERFWRRKGLLRALTFLSHEKGELRQNERASPIPARSSSELCPSTSIREVELTQLSRQSLQQCRREARKTNQKSSRTGNKASSFHKEGMPGTIPTITDP